MIRSRTESTAVDFDRFASCYDQLLQDPLRSDFASDPLHFYRRKWEVLERLLTRLGRRPQSMAWLDVGCGQGEFLELAGSHFATAVGCDPSSRMLSRGSSFDNRAQQHPCELPFPSQSFDLVSAICVYHHVPPSARPFLTLDIRRVLRPGGLFCVIEHNPYNLVTRRIVRRCPVDADAKLLSTQMGRKLFKESGLSCIWSEYFLFLPEKWFRKFHHLEPLLRRIPLGGQYVLVGRLPASRNTA